MELGMNFLFEGGNAKAKNGVEASKVNIKAFTDKQYESYKLDIINLILAINKKFAETYDEPLFPSNNLITSAKIFSGSGHSFFKKSKEEYTAVKPKLGDIDVQVDKKKKDQVKEFLVNNEGTNFAGFTLLGTQFGMDFFNIFQAPKKYNPAATNIQIDFEFVNYNEQNDIDEFDIFSKNSSWDDLKQGIKGFAKQQLLPAIYKAVYAVPGVVFQNKKDFPSKGQKGDEVSYKTFGPMGSRVKYNQVKDAEGNPVNYEGKPAFREIPTAQSTFNRNLDVAFKEMFGKKPSPEEKKQMYSFVGVLSLMKKFLTEKQIQRTYKFFYDDISTRTEDEGVLSAIFNKFKEVFPFVKEQNESLSFEKYTKQMMLGETFNKGNLPKFSLGTINVFKNQEWKIGNLLGEANEVAGSEENIKYIAKTIVDNIETGNDGKLAKVWISGGAVRDEILGKPCNDIDLLTNCDVNDVAQLFDKCEIARVGNSKLARIWVNGDLFELGCLNEGGTIEENLNSRDLTCNAVLKDIIENKYFDPIGGIKDIKAKIIRFTKAANEKISSGKDPSELLRAFRFMAQLGWDFAPETEKAIASYSKLNNGKIKVQMKAATGPANWKKLINGKFKNKAFAKLQEFGFIDWAKSNFPQDFN